MENHCPLLVAIALWSILLLVRWSSMFIDFTPWTFWSPSCDLAFCNRFIVNGKRNSVLENNLAVFTSVFQLFRCCSWRELDFHPLGLQTIFQNVWEQELPMCWNVASNVSNWWCLFVFHKVSKGSNNTFVQSHAFEPMYQSLFKLAAWKLEIWRNKLEHTFDKPFVLNWPFPGAIIFTIISEAQISCITIVRKWKLLGIGNCLHSHFLNSLMNSELLIKWTLQCSHGGLASSDSPILKCFRDSFHNSWLHTLLKFQHHPQVRDDSEKISICLNMRWNSCRTGNQGRWFGCNQLLESPRRSGSWRMITLLKSWPGTLTVWSIKAFL